MNKVKIVSSLLACAIPLSIQADCLNSCDCEITGRSYLAGRQYLNSSSPELISAFRSERTNARFEGRGGAVQAVIFGGKSIQTADTRRYFTPFCKTCLTADNSTDFSIDRDLFTNHFNIFYPAGVRFKSELSFNPQQTAIGLGLHYRQSFWHNEDRGRAFWFSISSPLTRLKNNMNLKETILEGANAEIDEDADTEGTVQPNLKSAFQQSEWNFGKIDCKSRTETRLADIEVKIGYEWLQYDPYHLESYAGVIIPTGNVPDGKFIFDAIVGNGHHFGVLFGNAGGFEVWANEEYDRNLRVEYTTQSQYLFEKTQTRSFDLKYRPFSRYMEVYANEEQALKAFNTPDELGMNLATPGINVFTQKVDVTPGFSHNITTAFIFTSGKFQAEGGYNFYARRAECLKLHEPWKEGPALKHFEGRGSTNPIREITANERIEKTEIKISIENYKNNIIKESDLDLISASTPSYLAHTFYGALGYRWDERDYPLFINGGASYELSHSNNAALRRWTLWGKCGFSF